MMAPKTIAPDQAKNNTGLTIALILVVILLAILPLFTVKNAEFGGADGQAETAITKLNAGYKPWFAPLIEPSSGEIESLLFALQAALGAGVIGYGLGYLKARYQKGA